MKDKEKQPEIKAAYSVSEVADLLGLHPATISGYIKSGELRAARLGHRTIRISHEALMDFLRTKEEETMRELEIRRQDDKSRGTQS